jgi:Mrp family chromosome partitioning ATPase
VLCSTQHETAKYEEAIVASSHSRNLFLLPAGTPLAPPPELFAGPRWKEFIGWTAECFNLVIVDTTPILSVADFDLIASGCDRTLLVVRARRTLREALERALEKLDRKKLMGTVFNGTEASEHSRYDDSYYYSGYYGRSGEQRRKHSAGRSKAVAAEK